MTVVAIHLERVVSVFIILKTRFLNAYCLLWTGHEYIPVMCWPHTCHMRAFISHDNHIYIVLTN